MGNEYVNEIMFILYFREITSVYKIDASVSLPENMIP